MKTGTGMAMALVVFSAGCVTTGRHGASATQQKASIQIEFQTLAVDSATFAAMSPSKLLSPEELTQLKSSGKAETISVQVISTVAAAEATIKSVKEWIYPTDVQYNSEDKQKKGEDTIVGGVVAPSGFETREIGGVLSVLAETSTNDHITLTLSYQIIGGPTWEVYAPILTGGGKKDEAVQMKQPIFTATSSSTTLTVRDGQRAIVGASPEPTDGKKTLVFIVGAHVVR